MLVRPIECSECLDPAVRPRNAEILHDLAFKSEAALFPNYGKTVGMDPYQWWSNVRWDSDVQERFFFFISLGLSTVPFVFQKIILVILRPVSVEKAPTRKRSCLTMLFVHWAMQANILC